MEDLVFKAACRSFLAVLFIFILFVAGCCMNLGSKTIHQGRIVDKRKDLAYGGFLESNHVEYEILVSGVDVVTSEPYSEWIPCSAELYFADNIGSEFYKKNN